MACSCLCVGNTKRLKFVLERQRQEIKAGRGRTQDFVGRPPVRTMIGRSPLMHQRRVYTYTTTTSLVHRQEGAWDRNPRLLYGREVISWDRNFCDAKLATPFGKAQPSKASPEGFSFLSLWHLATRTRLPLWHTNLVLTAWAFR